MKEFHELWHCFNYASDNTSVILKNYIITLGCFIITQRCILTFNNYTNEKFQNKYATCNWELLRVNGNLWSHS